jgi:hypothetical protein
MNPSRLFLLSFTLVSFFVFNSEFLAKQVEAHVGGGPPFLKINGEYAKTNPLIYGYPDFQLNITQDILTKNPITGEEIKFLVETNKLALPQELKDTALFRWTWGDESNSVLGKEQTHRYQKDGSYIVILEMTFPGQDSYIVLDTVQINSVPSSSYILPKPHISVKQTNLVIGEPIKFEYEVKKQKGTFIQSEKWRLDNNDYSTEKKVSHTFKSPDSTNFVFLKVTDSNNFTGFAGIILDATNGQIEKKDLDNPVISDFSVPMLYYYGGGFILLCIGAYFLSQKVRSKKQN